MILLFWAMEKLEQVLKKYGLRVTKARLQVLREYMESKKPLSIYDFKKKKIFSTWNESSLYRNMTKLEEAGVIRQVPSAQDFKLYEMNDKEKKHHHHHIICTLCKAVECLTNCQINHNLKKMAEKVGFSVEGHNLELYGRCSRCQN